MTERFNFVYDPARQGFDSSMWKVLSGSVVSLEIERVDTLPTTTASDVPYESFSVSESVSVTTT
jgi:hypothetical protein